MLSLNVCSQKQFAVKRIVFNYLHYTTEIFNEK